MRVVVVVAVVVAVVVVIVVLAMVVLDRTDIGLKGYIYSTMGEGGDKQDKEGIPKQGDIYTYV
jgi:hypothetical protein